MVRKANPKEITVKIDEDNTYVLKVPTGALGWKHFRILMEVENERKNTIKEWRKDTREVLKEVREDPKTKEFVEVTRDNPTFGKDIEIELPNPKLDEVMVTCVDKWVSEILPNILVSHEFDNVEWSHIMILFRQTCENQSIDMTNFRTDNTEGV